MRDECERLADFADRVHIYINVVATRLRQYMQLVDSKPNELSIQSRSGLEHADVPFPLIGKLYNARDHYGLFCGHLLKALLTEKADYLAQARTRAQQALADALECDKEIVASLSLTLTARLLRIKSLPVPASFLQPLEEQVVRAQQEVDREMSAMIPLGVTDIKGVLQRKVAIDRLFKKMEDIYVVVAGSNIEKVLAKSVKANANEWVHIITFAAFAFGIVLLFLVAPWEQVSSYLDRR